MKYDLFLFDLDDTLLDFKASERLSFFSSLQGLGIKTGLDELFHQYQIVNTALWKMFEHGQTSKEHLKVERFRHIFAANKIAIDPALASARYLDTLPETVVLIDYAVELCQWLSQRGELGIITNGIHYVQTLKIKNSQIAPYISFVSVSEECGFAKPDVRFFEYSTKMAKTFTKERTLVVGDRLDADIQGAHNFGVDCCWFNPEGKSHPPQLMPTYDVKNLKDIRGLLS